MFFYNIPMSVYFPFSNVRLNQMFVKTHLYSFHIPHYIVQYDQKHKNISLDLSFMSVISFVFLSKSSVCRPDLHNSNVKKKKNRLKDSYDAYQDV